MTDNKNKIISLSKRKEELEAAATAEPLPKEVVETDFEAEMKMNEAKKKKAAEERLKANKSVLRSYRIKK